MNWRHYKILSDCNSKTILGNGNALQIYTAGIGTHVKSVKVTSICHRYYHVKV